MRKSYPIPDDYDEKWECVSIEWPSSIKWRGILVGLLYSMSRGRSWDERTGRITDVQTIGREIFDRNYPLSVCSTDGDCSNGGGNDISNPVYCCGDWNYFDDDDCEDCEENDMSNCCLKNQIRLENGVLQVLDCGEWVDIGGVSSQDTKTSEPDSSTKTPEETGDAESDFRCAKATAVINTLWDVFQATFDHWDDLPWPIGAIENQVGLDLNNNWVSVMCIAMFDVSQIDKDMADIVHNNNKQTAICRLYPKLDGTTNGVSDNDWKQIQALMETLSSDPIEGSFIDLCIRAIGRGTFDRLCKVSILNMTGNDCGCPAVVPPDEIIPINHTWSLVMDFTQGDYGTTKNPSLTHTHYVAGVGWVNDQLLDNGANLPQFGRTGANDAAELCQLRYVKVHVKTWPTSLVVGGGQPQFLRVGNSWNSAVTANRGAEYLVDMPLFDFNLATRIEFGWNEWFTGAGNGVYSAVIDKIIMAGTGGDYWSLLNPDGTWG